MEIIVATLNEDKLKEIENVSKGYDFKFTSLKKYFENNGLSIKQVDEDGKTIKSNSIIKAKAALAVTGLPSLADDTGLVVPALGGEPGVFSARYACSPKDLSNLSKDEIYNKNNEFLLKKMQKISNRAAYFSCYATLAMPCGDIFSFEGRLNGQIGMKQVVKNGFGYDTVFVLNNGLFLSQLTLEEKNKISHRGEALRKLFEYFTQV